MQCAAVSSKSLCLCKLLSAGTVKPKHLTCCDITQGDRDSTQLKLEDTLEQLSESREMYERTLLEQQAHSKTKDAIALEEKTKELSQLKATLDQYVHVIWFIQCRFRHSHALLMCRAAISCRHLTHELDPGIAD